jgi:hypothetical protein
MCTLCFLVIFYINANAQKLPVRKTEQHSSAVTRPSFVVLPYRDSESVFYGFGKNVKQGSLDKTDLKGIDTILKNVLSQHGLRVHLRQYVCVLDQKGDKLVWVNCFCSAHNNEWRKEVLVVSDGGNCYYSFIVNLTTGKYYNLMVNGEA